VRRSVLMMLVAMLALGSLVLAGCAPEAAPPSGEEGGGTAAPAEEEEEEAPAAPEAEVIHWQYQGHPAVADYYHNATIRIADHITRMSGGRLTVEAFSGGAIVPATEELQGVHEGVLDMGSGCPMYAVNKFPACPLFDMVSGGMTGIQMTLWHLRGEGDELAARMWEENMNVKYVGTCGFMPAEVWAHTNKELKTPADLKGLKMRCAGDGGEILASMGVSTVFFPANEIYESAQRGVINAFECASPFLNWGFGFQEVADYMYLSPSRAPTDVAHVWVNRDRWEELSPDLQLVVMDACEAVGIDYFADCTVMNDVAVVQYLDYGTEVLPVPEAIEDAYLEAALEFYAAKAAADPFYAEVLDSHWEFKALCDRAGVM